MDLRCLQSFLSDARNDRVEQGCGLPRPTGERRTVDIDPPTTFGRRHHLGLAVERQMMVELVHDHMGERCEAGLATCNRLGRCRGLNDLIAGAAAILGPHGPNHAPLHGQHIEHLVAVFAQGAQGAATIGAGAAACRRFDPAFLARQMRRQRPDRRGALARLSASSASPSSSSSASSSCSIWSASFSDDAPKVIRRNCASWMRSASITLSRAANAASSAAIRASISQGEAAASDTANC